MSNPYRRVLLIPVWVLLATPLLAQTAERPAPERLPEEITVTGQRLFSTLQKQIREAEDRMYGLFNELNTDDLYDIHCAWEAPLGTRIRQRNCRPNFYVRATERDAQAFLGLVRGETGGVATPVSAELAVHYPILQRRMEELVREHPELREAVAKLLDARRQLDERKSSYFQGE